MEGHTQFQTTWKIGVAACFMDSIIRNGRESIHNPICNLFMRWLRYEPMMLSSAHSAYSSSNSPLKVPFLPLGFPFGVVHIERTSIRSFTLFPTRWKRRGCWGRGGAATRRGPRCPL